MSGDNQRESSKNTKIVGNMTTHHQWKIEKTAPISTEIMRTF